MGELFPQKETTSEDPSSDEDADEDADESVAPVDSKGDTATQAVMDTDDNPF